ncbi:MAG TPA: hypothetical protein VI976_01940 [Candidatus Omnitrophota bacterium]|nr:hypothetical protein [Candidatus Omnitrophota bacterium]
MQGLEEVKRRFLKNNLAVRLGCIAADLARLDSFARMPNNEKAVSDLVEESKFFIEWTAPKASLDVQEKLVNLQIQLALWNYSMERSKIKKSADKWSREILKLSGLTKK